MRHLVGSAIAWGGNPEQDALYLNVTPPRNDGKTVYRLNVKNVPVDGFWSISVYDAKGYFAPNAQNAYSLNNLTAKPVDDGSFAIQFGGCDGRIANCLPTPPGWNYLVRLYRPRPEILNGAWTFPSRRRRDDPPRRESRLPCPDLTAAGVERLRRLANRTRFANGRGVRQTAISRLTARVDKAEAFGQTLVD